MKKEKTLGDMIFSTIREEEDPVTKGNRILFGKDGGPPHMEPGPYEDDDADFCAYCGDELKDGHDVNECKKDFRRDEMKNKSLP